MATRDYTVAGAEITPRPRTLTLTMTPVAFLDQPDLVRIAPVPTPRHVLGGQDLDVRCERKVDHKVGLTITQRAPSDGPRPQLHQLIA